MLKSYADFTKFGIIIFVILTGLAGYATSYSVEQAFSLQHFIYFVIGLYCLSSGSLALNQVQEIEADRKMPRTEKRPLVSGKISWATGLVISLGLLLVGSVLLFFVSRWALYLGLATVVLYNGVYTYWWKPKWIYGAVPGAIPGALPVSIGYAANSDDLLRPDSIYLFLILFLWQMPHFWALALRYREDYRLAGVPTLPTILGVEKTIYQMGLYTFIYVGLALASPWFVGASWIYLLCVLPVSAKLMYEFFRFYQSKGEKGWLSFFLWINLSVLIYLAVPVIDRWSFLFIKSG